MGRNITDYNEVSKVNNIGKLEQLKENFDKEYEKRKKLIESEVYAKSMVNKPFGFIKEATEALSGELFKSKEGRSILNKYIACIKEGSELKKMHLLRECVRKANKNTDLNSYLTEAVSMIKLVNKDKADKQSLNAGKVLAEACRYLGKDKSESIIDSISWSDRLDEAIRYIETKQRKPGTLAGFYDSINVIKESMSDKESDSNLVTNELSEERIAKTINDFNEKFGKELDESGQKLVKELAESKDKKDIFERYKADCLNKLSEKKTLFENQGDKLTSERLGIVLEKIDERSYNPDTVNEDIFNFIEMVNSL